MKLGSQTGSVINHLMASGTIGQPEPTIGMGVTILSWSDRKAGTITRTGIWAKCKAIEVREDHSRVVSGSTHDGTAKWEYAPNPTGNALFFVFKDDQWRRATNEADPRDFVKLKLYKKGSGQGLRIGSRETYYDPSF